MPPVPAAPASIEFSFVESATLSVSPFTYQQQLQDWGGSTMEASVRMPAMIDSVAQPWITFLKSLKGPASVFQFSSSFASAYPASLGSIYWRLKGNAGTWSITRDRVYLIQFDIRQAQ